MMFLAYVYWLFVFAETGRLALLPGLGGGTDLQSEFWLESHTLQGFGGAAM